MPNPPAGFQRWPLIWFRCPSCGHHTYASIAQIRLPLAKRSLFRFWCERCGSLSVLKGPLWLPGALALCAIGLSLLTEKELVLVRKAPQVALNRITGIHLS